MQIIILFFLWGRKIWIQILSNNTTKCLFDKIYFCQLILLFNLFLLLFMSFTVFFGTIYSPHCTFLYYSWVSLYYFSQLLHLSTVLSVKKFLFQQNKRIPNRPKLTNLLSINDTCNDNVIVQFTKDYLVFNEDERVDGRSENFWNCYCIISDTNLRYNIVRLSDFESWPQILSHARYK